MAGLFHCTRKGVVVPWLLNGPVMCCVYHCTKKGVVVPWLLDGPVMCCVYHCTKKGVVVPWLLKWSSDVLCLSLYKEGCCSLVA